jgi:hypothetical protein
MLNGGDRGAALKRYKTKVLWPQIQSKSGDAWGMLEWLVHLARIERTGQNRARRGKETGIRAPWTWQLTEEEVTV